MFTEVARVSLSCSAAASTPGRGVAHVGSGEDLPHLVGEHLDAEAGDEARHHGAREEVGEERQPEDPEDEEQQRADQRQGQRVLHAKRIPGRGEGDEGGPDQGGHGGVGARHQVARAGQQGEHDQRNDGRVETGRGRQAGDLRVADVERDHQGGQRDARRDLPGDVGQRDALQTRERARPADLGETREGCSSHGHLLHPVLSARDAKKRAKGSARSAGTGPASRIITSMRGSGFGKAVNAANIPDGIAGAHRQRHGAALSLLQAEAELIGHERDPEDER